MARRCSGANGNTRAALGPSVRRRLAARRRPSSGSIIIIGGKRSLATPTTISIASGRWRERRLLRGPSQEGLNFVTNSTNDSIIRIGPISAIAVGIIVAVVVRDERIAEGV